MGALCRWLVGGRGWTELVEETPGVLVRRIKTGYRL